MRRPSLALLALSSLPFGTARQPSFSIHQDLLAHPQFEVIFSDSYISDADAFALLEAANKAPTPTPASDGANDDGSTTQTDLTSEIRESATANADSDMTGDDTAHGSSQLRETYELIAHPPMRYLCSIPIIAPPPALNKTATELAKAEEAREVTRAYNKGWELMRGLENECLHFVSGWWSYQYCYGKSIVQYHAVPNPKGGPPLRDKNTQEYILGTSSLPSSQSGQKGKQIEVPNTEQKQLSPPPNTELQAKDNQRYLVQRLDGGTICDLTGRPRAIEIQYHCNPALSGDRIGWIKEVTTCAYLMVIHTPRLCADVAFLPPKETKAHPITCQQVIASEEEALSFNQRRKNTIDSSAAPAATAQDQKQVSGSGSTEKVAPSYRGLTVAGIPIGGRRIIPSTHVLPLPRHLQKQRQEEQQGNLLEALTKAAFKADVFGHYGEKVNQQQGAAGKGKGAGAGAGAGGKGQGGSGQKKEMKKMRISERDIDKLGLDQQTLEAIRAEIRAAGLDPDRDLDDERGGGGGGEMVWEFYADVDEGDYEDEGGTEVFGHGEEQGQDGQEEEGEGSGSGNEEGSKEAYFRDEL
ncbi:glucosidase II beta subunit-like protein-domain-containing protein [Pseudoneurospora amorphoporcata]|uniref:Endoplasmic reticulum lectin n=1 Tax=Pseudoneurospora amorphoporcata TaxID=241081 RepID=A0AAN6NS96_9PEZI|nr:glucosidase II beta subunit-like protein-domain-containing protein [Pseudoneurospora amorphoporcata]